MHFFISRKKKHCSIFVNIFYNKRCNYSVCVSYFLLLFQMQPDMAEHFCVVPTLRNKPPDNNKG